MSIDNIFEQNDLCNRDDHIDFDYDLLDTLSDNNPLRDELFRNLVSTHFEYMTDKYNSILDNLNEYDGAYFLTATKDEVVVFPLSGMQIDDTHNYLWSYSPFGLYFDSKEKNLKVDNKSFDRGGIIVKFNDPLFIFKPKCHVLDVKLFLLDYINGQKRNTKKDKST